MRMLQIGVVTAFVAVAMGASLAQAQPRLKRRAAEERHKGPPGLKKPAKTDNFCPQRQRVLAEEESRLDSYQADASGVDAEIRELERRLAELRTRQSGLKNVLTAQQRRVDSLRTSYRSECDRAQDCQNYESLAESLERQATPMEDEVKRVRDEIAGTQSEVRGLQAQVGGLQSEYGSKQCANLVPGETDQSTIDRCSTIFSDWNRLQASLNRANDRLPELRRRYERLLTQLDGVERRAAEYEAYLNSNCKSQRVTKLRGYKGARQRAASLGRELDALVDQVSKLRGVQITVTPR